MKDKTKETLKHIIKVFALVEALIIIVSIYFSSYLHFLFTKGELIIDPIRHWHLYKEVGFPSGAVIVMVSLGTIFLIVTLVKKYSYLISLDKERNFKYSNSGVYGTAQLLTKEQASDVANFEPIEKAMGPILGRLDNETTDNVINLKRKLPINKHTCIFGASRSGKTYCYVLPYALQAARRRESLIMTDPKGELYEKTSEYFRSLGYVVRRFDLKNPSLSDGWDCIKEIIKSNDLPENRAATFANIVIENAGGNSAGNIHDKGPKLLLTALLLRIVMDEEFAKKGKQNIGTCIEMLTNPMGAAYLDTEVFDSDLVPDSAKSCITAYNSFKLASANLYGNILTGLAATLGVFASESIRELTSRDDIDMTLPGRKPCVYYCIMSDMHSTLNFLGALFFSFLFLDLAEFADSQPDNKCPVPVNFLLDEFANIGAIPDFDKKMAVIASRDMNVSIILQDKNQLENRYPYTFGSIMSNCATHLCIGFNDADTEEYYAKRAGETTVQVATEQKPEHEVIPSPYHRQSAGVGRRQILNADELARMDRNRCLIVWQSHDVMQAYKFPADLHPEYKKLVRCPAGVYPSIFDKEGRDAMHKQEAEYVEAFQRWYDAGGDPFEYLHRVSVQKSGDKGKWERFFGRTNEPDGASEKITSKATDRPKYVSFLLGGQEKDGSKCPSPNTPDDGPGDTVDDIFVELEITPFEEEQSIDDVLNEMEINDSEDEIYL